MLCPDLCLPVVTCARGAPYGVSVIATDPSTRRDIPKFCVFLGHELLGQAEEDGTYLYWIRKKTD